MTVQELIDYLEEFPADCFFEGNRFYREINNKRAALSYIKTLYNTTYLIDRILDLLRDFGLSREIVLYSVIDETNSIQLNQIRILKDGNKLYFLENRTK